MTKFLASFALVVSILACLSATIDQLLRPYGYTVAQTSLMGAFSVASGLVGALTVGVIVDRTRQYLLVYRTLVVGCFVFSLPFLWTLPSGNVALLLPNIALVFAVALPLVPLGVGLAVELAFPVSEAVSVGWLLFWSGAVALGVTYLGSWLCQKDPMLEIVLFGILGLGAITSTCFVKEELNRLNRRQESDKDDDYII